jgi:hypothetical protein
MTDIYTVPFTATVTNAGGDCDLWEITPADDLPLRIRGIRLGQTSEVGDTAEEGLRISIIRLPATVTSGSGGSAGVPRHVQKMATNPSFTSETNNTTVATTSGTAEILEELSWNVRNSPFEIWYPDPVFAPKVVQAGAIVIRMQTTPADDFTFAGTLWIEEG